MDSVTRSPTVATDREGPADTGRVSAHNLCCHISYAYVLLIFSIVDGTTPDPRAQDPVAEVFSLLSKQKDPSILRKYGLWLVKRDRDMGLQVTTGHTFRDDKYLHWYSPTDLHLSGYQSRSPL